MRLSHRVGWLLAAAVVVWAWQTRSASAADPKQAGATKPKDGGEVRPETDMRQRLDRASQAFEQGRFAEAKSEYERATKQDPGNIRAWVGLGWSYWQLGDKQQALKIWNDVLKVNPNDPKILVALAQAHEANGAWSEALDYYERLIKMGAEPHEAHFGKARVLERLGRLPQAEEELKIVLAKTPNDANAQFMLARVYLATKRRDQAEAILKQLAARSPDPKYLRILGDGMLQLGHYDEAEAYYRKSLEREPDHRGTVLSLSRAYARDHRFPEAVEVLKPYVARHPDDEQAREELAKAAASGGNFAEAESVYRQLIQQHPDDNEMRMRLAKALRQGGQADKGVTVAKEVLARDPKNTDALGLLADDAQLAGHDEDAIRWLNQLAAAQPIPSRLNQLGRMHMQRGAALRDQADESAANDEYRAAMQAFGVSSKLEPSDSDSQLGTIAAMRLSGDADKAIVEGERMLASHPSLQALQLELFQAYSEQGQYEKAEEHINRLLQVYPGNVGLEQQIALLDFNEGQRADGIERLQKMLKMPLEQRVPILLYHGISRAPRTPSAIAAEDFRDQMVSLKKNGYNSISLEQFIDFVSGKGSLPPKPILITFDDARSDSVENADPVLKELGFRASLFIPAGEIGQHGPYYAGWRNLQELQASGRWEMQCHAYLGHRTIPIDKDGHTGRFFTDREWLADQNRLETEQEFYQRLDEDYRGCKEVVERQVPGAHVLGYAYPFGDIGQRRFNNEPNAVKINEELVKKYYRVAFVEDPFGMATPRTPALRMPRYELQPGSKGEDLMRKLTSNDPMNSTLFLLGQLYAWSGRFADANDIYATLEKRGYDRPTLLAAQAQALQWSGDFASARSYFDAALAARPNDPLILRKVDQLNQQVAPTVGGEGSYYADNRHRSNLGVGPFGKVFLTDRWSVSAKYQYREFTHDRFNLSQLAAPSGSSSSTTPAAGTTTAPETQTFAETVLPAGTTGRAKLRATGNEAEGQLEYQIDGRTGFGIAGGVADFTDHSSPRVLEGDETYPLASGRASFGLGDDVDLALGGSHGYIASAGTILDHIAYSGGQAQLTIRPLETWTIFGQGIGEVYDGGNNRISGLFRLSKAVWVLPTVELGYQLVYDDAKKESPFFYTPNRFIANEGVFTFHIAETSPLSAIVQASVGEGSEQGGNVEVEGSVSGAFDLRLGKHFHLLASGARTQSAKFESYEGRGSLAIRF